MSDFFSSLTAGNVRFPDARINGDGPLPTTLSGPAGVHGDADGKYNFNDNLLSGITPYAMPGTGRMGSDRNYQQIPHRKQFPVPPIYLPEPEVESEKSFMVSHAIDMGDLVFIVNLRNKHTLLTDVTTTCLTVRHDQTGGVMPQYNVFCNICTANYLLAGIRKSLRSVTTQFVGEQLNRELSVRLNETRLKVTGLLDMSTELCRW